MALVSVGRLEYPKKVLKSPGGVNGQSWSSLSAITYTLDSTSDKLAWVGRSPVTDTLTTVYFMTGTIPASGGDDLDIRIETVTNGRPTGTLWAANTNVTVTVADSDDLVWKTATLTSAASLNQGDEFAIVIASSAGTPNVLLNSCAATFEVQSYSLQVFDTGTGSWGTTVNSGPYEWICQFGTAGVVGMQGMLPLNGDATITAFNSGTSPDERAMKFQLPFKARVIGAGVGVGNIAAGGDLAISLWPASSTTDSDALAQETIDGDTATSTSNDGYMEVLFSSAVTLEKDTVYYLGVRAETANNISVYQGTVDGSVTNAIRGFFLPDGDFHLSTRAWTAGSAGAWTDTTTTLPFFYLIIDQVDDGTGAGSGSMGISQGLHTIGNQVSA